VSDLGVSLEAWFDETGVVGLPLPDPVTAAYGGPFALSERVVYGNFVASIDGVAAIAGIRMSSVTISGREPADRFVMGLLRAVSDAVVIGSGTLAEHDGPWTAERVYPPMADLVGPIRAAAAAREAVPTLVVLTGSGKLPTDHPALDHAVIVTTSSGARTMVGLGITDAEVVDLGDADEIDPRAAIAELRARGYERILAEGGPKVMGSMLEASVVDEMFLTISPKLIGGGEGRPPFSDGAKMPEHGSGARLMSLRRSEDYLFLRYGLRAG
jgi:riboflavin biosynthesis pyrimidine reductase